MNQNVNFLWYDVRFLINKCENALAYESVLNAIQTIFSQHLLFRIIPILSLILEYEDLQCTYKYL